MSEEKLNEAELNENSNPNTYVAPQVDENTFDPEKDRAEQTKKETKKIKQKWFFKWYFIVPMVLLLIIIIAFVGWQIKAKTYLNVCVLDKTVLVAEEDNDVDNELAYRKHEGLFWLLNQKKIVFQDGSAYDYTNDYFGQHLKEDGTTTEMKELTTLDYVPDLMYISDVYGATNDTYGYFNDNDAKGSGFNADDMSVVSYAYENNATVIGEMELFNSNMTASVTAQLQSLFGISETGWVGRYIYDLQDFTDVPDWAPELYEQQSGVEWQFTGSGILLVSKEGKIIVLEQKTDFDSKNLLKIYLNEDYKKEFKGCKKTNFYNWFELIEANADAEALATFEFDVNATGMEKMAEISNTPRFVAITRKKVKNKPAAYYFAGDFNDYVSKKNINKFLGADKFFKFLSYDNLGDISCFYWKFYNPLMTKILKDCKAENGERHKNGAHESKNSTEVARVNNGKFEVLDGKKFKEFNLKAFSINANKPGETKYTRDYTYYQSLVEEMNEIGANCVRAKGLMPAEFYRAIYQNNVDNSDNKIYIIQTVTAPEGLSADKYLTDDGQKQWKKAIETVIKALHGDGSTKATSNLNSTSYFNDVSPYVLGVLIDANLTSANAKAIKNSSNGFTYTGKYFCANTPVEAFAAKLCDIAESKNVKSYGYKIPVGVQIDSNSVADYSLAKGDTKYDMSTVISANEKSKQYFFLAVNGELDNGVFAQNAKRYGSAYGDGFSKYLSDLLTAVKAPLLVSSISVSTNIGGNSESEQASKLIAGLNAVSGANTMGAVISDLNDNWSAVSSKMYPFTVPLLNNYLWHNVADSAQTTGIVSIDSKTPESTDLEYTDDDRMQGMSVSANESYLYINVRMLEEVDYSKEDFFVGIDTYQRNDGEYYYASKYTPTALSGMEFVIHFSSKQNAKLYVAKSYDKSKGNYSSKESYTGKYSLVATLKYGGFRSGDNQYYSTGTTTYIRIPWALLNVTDPTQKIVINNPGKLGSQAKTTQTNGFLISLMIADKSTKDLLYMFPESKQDPGYKTFKWNSWETVDFEYREKDGFGTLKKYFKTIK